MGDIIRLTPGTFDDAEKYIREIRTYMTDQTLKNLIIVDQIEIDGARHIGCMWFGTDPATTHLGMLDYAKHDIFDHIKANNK